MQKLRKVPSLLPDLVLESADPMRPTYGPIRPAHQLYALAAWAFHHSDELDANARDALLESLARAWPKRGRRKNPERALWMLELSFAGVPVEEIADKWHLTPRYVADVLRTCRQALLAAGTTPAPLRVSAYPVASDLPAAPPDPATHAGAALSIPPYDRHELDDWERADELAQAHGFESAFEMIRPNQALLTFGGPAAN